MRLSLLRAGNRDTHTVESPAATYILYLFGFIFVPSHLALLLDNDNMLRCVGCYEKFCRPLSLPPGATETDIRDAFRIKFPEIWDLESALIQVCKYLYLYIYFFLSFV